MKLGYRLKLGLTLLAFTYAVLAPIAYTVWDMADPPGMRPAVLEDGYLEVLVFYNPAYRYIEIRLECTPGLSELLRLEINVLYGESLHSGAIGCGEEFLLKPPRGAIIIVYRTLLKVHDPLDIAGEKAWVVMERKIVSSG